jgi:excisionase family DNA binding protein
MAMSTQEIEALPAAVTVKKTAQALGISLDSAYKAVHAGEIPSLKVGRLMLVPKAWLVQQLGLSTLTAGVSA